MADISELIIEVKQINKTLSDISKVRRELHKTSDEAKKLKSIGKTLFSGWGLTKIFGMVKKFGDAWKEVQVTFRNFDTVFGKWNSNAVKAVDRLSSKFHYTTVEAKNLMSIVGSRLSMFDFDTSQTTEVSETLSRLATEIGQFYNEDKSQVLDRLTGALAGQTKALKQYGINIDTTSSKFTEMVKKIKEVKHETEENAKALAIYDRLLKQSKQYEGTFSSQEKGISQALSDIAQTLKNGVFAEAGKVLSTLFVPVLEKLNELLSLNWVKRVGGFALAVGSIVGSLSLLKKLFSTVGLIPKRGILTEAGLTHTRRVLTVGLGHLSRDIAGFFTKLAPSFTAGLSSLFTTISKTWTGKTSVLMTQLFMGVGKKTATVMVAKIGGLGVLLGGILSAAIVIPLVIIFRKRIAQLLKSLWNWLNVEFAQFIESVFYFMAGGGFKSREGRWRDYKKNLDDVVFKQYDYITSVEEEIKDLDKKIKEVGKPKLNPKEEFENVQERLSDLKASLAKAESDNEKNKELYKRYRNKLYREYQNMLEQRAKDLTFEFKNIFKSDFWKKGKVLDKNGFLANIDDEIKKLSSLSGDYNGSLEKIKKLKKAILQASIDFEEIKEKARVYDLKLADNSFKELTWFWDTMNTISESIGKFTAKDKVKHFEELIDFFKAQFTDMSLKPEEAIQKYKELSKLEMDKFKAEMDGLNKEREFIKTTNEAIEEYLQKALEWTAQGVEGIQANTAEGYKFMTSGLSNISSLGPVLKDTQSQQIDLQKKANDIAEKTKNSITEISRQIDLLQGKTEVIKFNVVN